MNTALLEQIELATGAHSSTKREVCVMEAVALLAGEEWTDWPKCALFVAAEASYESLKLAQRSLADRASIGQSLLRAQGNA